MEKAFTFSSEQKMLVWSRFVQPAGGTQEEADHFIEVCETFGLNPLLNDIVFQRFNTKNGPKTQFITTRDGLLRVATVKPCYVGAPNANIVREGDDFEFIPSKGEVHHKFGQQRGQILGAYAVMRHEKFNPVAVFVDFQEYFNANSGELNSKYGNKNIWDKMPSAMIVKIAEVFVLRRQFPLGGLYTQEEMALENDGFSNEKNQPEQPITNNSQTSSGNNQPEQEVVPKVLNQEQIEELKGIAASIGNAKDVAPEDVIVSLGKSLADIPQSEFGVTKEILKGWLEKAQGESKTANNQSELPNFSKSEFISNEQVAELKEVAQNIASAANLPVDNILQTLGRPVENVPANQYEDVKEKFAEFLARANGQKNKNQQEAANEGNVELPQLETNNEQPQEQGGTVLNLIKKEEGVSPNGSNFIKLFVKEYNMPIFARTEKAINDAKSLEDNSSFTAQLGEESGFVYLKSVEHFSETA